MFRCVKKYPYEKYKGKKKNLFSVFLTKNGVRFTPKGKSKFSTYKDAMHFVKKIKKNNKAIAFVVSKTLIFGKKNVVNYGWF